MCSDVHVLLATSLLRLSFPLLRSLGSYFVVFVPDGLAPLVFPLSSSSFEVSSSRNRIKDSYSNDGMTFSI